MNSVEKHIRDIAGMMGVNMSISYRLALAHGRSMSAKDSAYTGRGELGVCFKNAVDLCLEDPQLYYCEGWALKPGLIPLEHAWAYDPEDDRVIDPTWQELDTEYFGMVFVPDAAIQLMVKQGVYGLLGNLYRHRKSVDTTMRLVEDCLWRHL